LGDKDFSVDNPLLARSRSISRAWPLALRRLFGAMSQ
jgi:hypothetical protein